MFAVVRRNDGNPIFAHECAYENAETVKEIALENAKTFCSENLTVEVEDINPFEIAFR